MIPTNHRTEALTELLAKQPARWRLLRHVATPLDFCRLKAADDGGGHWLELNAATFERLKCWIGRDIHGEGHQDTDWLRRDGANLLDAPDAASAFAVARVLFMSSKGMPFGMGQPYRLAANAYLLALWTGRRRGLIDVDTWAHGFVVGWILQSISFRESIGITQDETSLMLEDVRKADNFSWNQTYRQRGDLPATIKLYRGIVADEPDLGWLGQSWSCDRAAALGYIEHRRSQLGKRGWLAEACFHRDDVATVFEHQSLYHPRAAAVPYCEWIITTAANPIGLSVSPVRSSTESWAHGILAGMCVA